MSAVSLRKVTDDQPTKIVCTFNVPCPTAAHTFQPLTTIAGRPVAKVTDRPDYSDGYGSTYAVGE